MSHKNLDRSGSSNGRVLAGLLAPAPLLELRYLGPRPRAIETVKKNQRKVKITLARILA